MRYLGFLLLSLVCISVSQAYIQDYAPVHNKSYCIWYDQCLTSVEGKALNCLYNGPAKTLNDDKGIAILKKLCPKFAENRKTCCSTKQLETLDRQHNTIRKLLGHCPSCLQNFLDLFCEQTCSPDQSLFMDPTRVIGFSQTRSILKVAYYVSMDFKKGLFDSCKDVTMTATNAPVLNVLCGESAKTCQPQKLLEYIFSTSSGLSVFDTSLPEILPKNMEWMNNIAFRCNESYVNPWNSKTIEKCSCKDCRSSSHRAGEICKVNETDPYDHPPYRKAKLIITANPDYPQNNTGYHRYPDNKFIPFGHIFHLDLLNQALDLQRALTNMEVPYTEDNKTVYLTLPDVCYKSPNSTVRNKCVIESMFQYFQNNNTLLNYCVTSLGFECKNADIFDFRKADYHDHFLYCANFPLSTNDKKWGGSCLGENGLPVFPRTILGEFNATEYNMANYLYISFVFKNEDDERKNLMANAWEKAFLTYMKNYVQNPEYSNLTITFFANSSHINQTTTASPETTTSLPNTTTSLPNTTTSSPNTTTSSPNTTTSSPNTTTSSPNTTTSSPNTTTSSPNTTSSPETTVKTTTRKTTTVKPTKAKATAFQCLTSVMTFAVISPSILNF